MCWEEQEDVLDVGKEIVSSNPTCLWREIMDSNPTSLWRNWGQERALQVWTVFCWNWVRRVNPTWECQSFFCHLLRVNSLLCHLSFVMFLFIRIFVSDWLMLQDKRFLLLFLNTLPKWEHMYLIICQFWLCGVLLGEGKCYERKGKNRGFCCFRRKVVASKWLRDAGATNLGEGSGSGTGSASSSHTQLWRHCLNIFRVAHLFEDGRDLYVNTGRQ